MSPRDAMLASLVLLCVACSVTLGAPFTDDDNLDNTINSFSDVTVGSKFPEHADNVLHQMDMSAWKQHFMSSPSDHKLDPRIMSTSPHMAPRYMLELYDKFEKERYAHPVSNIVRSFQSIESHSEPVDSNIRVHTLMFNLSSVSVDEDISLSELRLHSNGASVGNSILVTISQVVTYTWDDGITEKEERRLAGTEIMGQFSRWEAIPITDHVRKWIKGDNTELQVLTVRVSSGVPWQALADGGVDISPDDADLEPLLVVFSNDKNRKMSAERDMREMLHHEMDLGPDVVDEDYEYDDDYMDEYIDTDYDQSNDVMDTSANQVTENELDAAEAANQVIGHKIYRRSAANESEFDNSVVSRQSEHHVTRRSTRSSHRPQHRNRRRRNSCRRKPLYVRFQDINWHNWIIAPEGYMAYECTGRCYYPLSDHLTPTNHAIIQTLLHTTYKKKASRACCVPTRLDPISILYIDEKGVVTYKYKYKDMVVAECGCR